MKEPESNKNECDRKNPAVQKEPKDQQGVLKEINIEELAVGGICGIY